MLPTLLMWAKGLIMLIPNRPWSNVRMGQGYYNEFLKLIRDDAIEVATHKMRGAIRMNFGPAV